MSARAERAESAASAAAVRWEPVIGLEVHAQLRTDSKLFCACSVRYGDAANHSTCPVCLALPGSLPVLNRRAVELAVRAGLATHCRVNPRSVFARKHYFYPDLPKAYQISQYEEPLASGGWIEIALEEGGEPIAMRIGLTRIHMEEDAGKSLHDDPRETHVDLNRTGIPLVEIVSEPELRSPEQAGVYLRKLRAILRAVEASDADMEKGQFRCDANISLRPVGATQLGTRTELKNLNSFRFVEAALHAEIARQTAILDAGGKVQQATLRYDPDRGSITVMRVKENADDYRYFPDPDLIPLGFDADAIEAARAALPELPDAKRARFERDYGLSAYDARLLTQSRASADFYEAALRACAESGGAPSPAEAPKIVANWVLRDVLALLRERDLELDALALRPPALAALIRLVEERRLTPRSARELLPELALQGGDPEALVRERGLEAVSDTGQLEGLADAVLAEHPEAVARFRAGDAKVVNFLMGRVMQKTGGKADASRVRELLTRKLSE